MHDERFECSIFGTDSMDGVIVAFEEWVRVISPVFFNTPQDPFHSVGHERLFSFIDDLYWKGPVDDISGRYP